MALASRRGVLGGLIASAAIAAPARSAALASVWQGIDLQGPDGRLFQLRELGRKVVLVKLWASWCPVCRNELAALSALSPSLSAVDVVLVSHPEFWRRDQAAARARDLPFRLATLADDTPAPLSSAALLDAAGAFTVPRTLAFRTGAEVWAHLGQVSWTSPDAVARLKSWSA